MATLLLGAATGMAIAGVLPQSVQHSLAVAAARVGVDIPDGRSKDSHRGEPKPVRGKRVPDTAGRADTTGGPGSIAPVDRQDPVEPVPRSEPADRPDPIQSRISRLGGSESGSGEVPERDESSGGDSGVGGDLTVQQIAYVLSERVGTIKALQRRAVIALRAQLETGDTE